MSRYSIASSANFCLMLAFRANKGFWFNNYDRSLVESFRQGCNRDWRLLQVGCDSSAVSLTFSTKFESVDIIFDMRSIAICRRSDSISPISLMLSRSLFALSMALSIFAFVTSSRPTMWRLAPPLRSLT